MTRPQRVNGQRPQCSRVNCTEPQRCSGLCHAHHMQWRRGLRPMPGVGDRSDSGVVHLAYAIATPAWRGRAACRGVDTELFYDPDDPGVQVALTYCAKCPVLRECRDYAIEGHEPYGTWGGLTEPERRKLRRGSA